MKRRILHKFKLEEISGVDRGAQEEATVRILKRRQETPVNSHEDLQAQLDDRVDELRKSGLSGCDALRQARREAPEKFDTYQESGLAKSDDADYEALIKAEIGGSAMPRHIAAQRIIQKYGPRPDANAIIAKGDAAAVFEDIVDNIMRDEGVTRSVAMARARRTHPLTS